MVKRKASHISEVINSGGRQIDREIQGLDPRLMTGITKIDQTKGMFGKAQSIIMAARPGVGKTAFACNIAYSISQKLDVLFYSLEMPKKQLGQRYLSRITGLTSSEVWSDMKGEKSFFQQAMDHAVRLKMFVDDDSGCTIDDILLRTRVHKQKYGLDLLIIDYLQLIKLSKERMKLLGTREQQVAYISREVKLLANELDITVLLLAQLNRSIEQRAPNDRYPGS